MSSRPSLRGGGDILTRRLASLRADILARGKSTYIVSASGLRPITCPPRSLSKVFAFLRLRGVSVCNVLERRTLEGLSCFVDSTGVDWLLLSEPIRIYPQKRGGLAEFTPRAGDIPENSWSVLPISYAK